MIIKVMKAGEPLLHAPAEMVTVFNSPELIDLVKKLFEAKHFYHGAGIAAPQIGVSKRVLVYGVKDNPRYPDAPFVEEAVLINPDIIFFSAETNDFHEGCLSLPHLRGSVSRANMIRYKAYTIEGTLFEKTAEGFEARVIQHEIDHLNGLLYPSRMKDLSSFHYTEN